LLAVVMTPLLTLLLADTRIEVPAASMLLSIVKMIIAPVALGVLIQHFLSARIRPLQPLFPLISVAAIVFIIAIIIALNADRLGATAPALLAAVVLHNLIGLAGGYTAARLAGFAAAERRTLAIEVGMQNSGLAVALAAKYFAASAALPGALFSIWHNLSGSLLAAYWSRRETPGQKPEQELKKRD
jgi:BASS family bile acid:Na+ symporter